MDIPEDFHDVLFGVDAGAGLSGSAATRAVIVRGDGDDLAPFHKNGAMNTCVVFLFQHECPRVLSEEFQNVSLGSFQEFHFAVKMVGPVPRIKFTERDLFATSVAVSNSAACNSHGPSQSRLIPWSAQTPSHSEVAARARFSATTQSTLSPSRRPPQQ